MVTSAKYRPLALTCTEQWTQFSCNVMRQLSNKSSPGMDLKGDLVLLSIVLLAHFVRVAKDCAGPRVFNYKNNRVRTEVLVYNYKGVDARRRKDTN